MHIKIGTRGSQLALWQANFTKDKLEKLKHTTEIIIIETQGDKTQQWNTSFDKIEGKGFFTKELEEALLNGTIDVAVHSLKDLPTEQPEGLIIAGVSERENPSDCLIIKEDSVDKSLKFSLKQNAIVGTSSARRKSQLLAFRPDITVTDLRGNVPTRIQKLQTEQLDAIMLASAGIERLKPNLMDFHVEELNPNEFIPAPAQGVIAWQVAENSYDLIDIFESICDVDVLINVNLERRLLNTLEGGCQMPIGIYCTSEVNDKERKDFYLTCSYANAWNEQPIQIALKATNTASLPDKITKQIKNLIPQSVFISRDKLETNDFLAQWLENLKFDVECKSLIERKKLTIKQLPKTDWIFFSNVYATQFFFMQKPDIGKTKIGCMNKEVSKIIRKEGYSSEFIGQNADIKLIGKQFAACVGTGTVLIPIERDSTRMFQWQFAHPQNVFDLPIFASVPQGYQIKNAPSVLVFIDLANLTAHLATNKILPNQKIIVVGVDISKMLYKLKIPLDQYYHVPNSVDIEVFRAILSII